jgi:hypothetical protein
MNIAIMRAFVSVRHALLKQTDLKGRIQLLCLFPGGLERCLCLF